MADAQPSSSRDALASPNRSHGHSHGSSHAHDAMHWFDSANRDPSAALGGAMSVDAAEPPFYPESDASPPPPPPDVIMLPPGTSFRSAGAGREETASTVAEEYRSVIDDLTIENKRLKEALKRYRLNANRDVMEKEKLFELKMHGLPRRKKQELEATLRDFAASINTDSASGDSKSTSRYNKRDRERDKTASSRQKSSAGVYSLAGPSSKHASTTSSRSRPVDSAYASMSTGANSSGAILARPSFGGPQARTSEQKVERYLQDIPEGLHPNYGMRVLSDKDKKKLIVRRLEQLFTGKIAGRYTRRNRAMLPPVDGAGATDEKYTSTGAADDVSRESVSGGGGGGADAHSGAGFGSGSGSGSGIGAAGAAAGAAGTNSSAAAVPPSAVEQGSEPTREALIQIRQNNHKWLGSRDNLSQSNSNSNGDDANGNGNGKSTSRSAGNWSGIGTGTGISKSPTDASVPEQRPTRPLDLDPDRVQVPADNMEYIRHLGLVPPEIQGCHTSTLDVSPDADGWVYLNLLSNLAQLHIFNVAPDFIRKAIVEKSTKFQLSPDGQKIRWRGGTDGTRFSSDGSGGENGSQGPSTDDGDGSDENGQRKKARMSGDGSASALSSSRKQSKRGPHASKTSSSFHYKPIFVRQNSDPLASAEELSSATSGDAVSSYPQAPVGSNSHRSHKSSSDQDASGGGRHQRRLSDGIVVYYSGAPFCADLAGDSGGGTTTPATFATSSDAAKRSNSHDTASSLQSSSPALYQTDSGARTLLRPLTDFEKLTDEEQHDLVSGSSVSGPSEGSQADDSMSASDSQSDDVEAASRPSEPLRPYLEASGIGRVFPDDHFSVMVTTRRPAWNAHNGNREGATVCSDDGKDDGGNHGHGVFSMGSLMKRLAALKKQTAPISGAVPRQNRSGGPRGGITYVSAKLKRHDPVPLPPPVLFYPPFSPSSSSSDDDESTSLVDEDDEDESMLASSSEEMISRRANPHQSDNNPTAASLDSGDEVVRMADGDKEDDEMMIGTD